MMMVVSMLPDTPVDFFQRKYPHKDHPITGPPVGTREPMGIFPVLPVTAGQYIWVGVYGTLGGPA